MLQESLEYLWKSEKNVETILIGGVLTLLSFLILPMILVAGYTVRVLDRSAHGGEEAPIFDDWGAMFVDGAKAFAIMIVYGLAPLAAIVLTAITAAIAFSISDALGLIAMLLGGLITLVLGLAVMYAIPAALANYAQTREIRAGFEYETLRPALTSGTYAVGWLTAIAIVIGGALVAGVLNVVPILGFIAGAFVAFYAGVSAYYVIGHTWADVRPIETREEPRTAERPAV